MGIVIEILVLSLKNVVTIEMLFSHPIYRQILSVPVMNCGGVMTQIHSDYEIQGAC